MRDSLLTEFTSEEICEAIKNMPSQKAAGPNGYTAEFYQHHWETIGDEVCEVALNFFNSANKDASIMLQILF
jgi:hypothetical protein